MAENQKYTTVAPAGHRALHNWPAEPDGGALPAAAGGSPAFQAGLRDRHQAFGAALVRQAETERLLEAMRRELRPPKPYHHVPPLPPKPDRPPHPGPGSPGWPSLPIGQVEDGALGQRHDPDDRHTEIGSKAR
jgi:hypothetical protein